MGKNNVTSYAYDSNNRMKSVTFAAGGVNKTITYKYDRNGNRESTSYDSGITESYTYDKNNRIKTLVNKAPNGSVISTFSYDYDLAGREVAKKDNYGTSSYSYDAAGRITTVQAPGKTTVYRYDNAGNRLSLSETYVSDHSSDYIDPSTGNPVKYRVKTTNYTYSDGNKLLQVKEIMYKDSVEVLQMTVNYSYDNNGNELSKNASYKKPSDTGSTVGLTANNSYDGFNKLKSVETIKSGKTTVTDYLYNGDDLRIQKVTKSSADNYVPETTNYLYDRQHVILETDGSDNVKVRYVIGINYIARIDSQSKLSYFLFNGHGDVVQTAGADGTVENSYDYDIFGEITLEVEKYSNSIMFGGEYYDIETGLYYLRARYYDAGTGRFISEDSYWGEDNNPLSLNLYTFCFNDPIRFIDPSGHYAIENGVFVYYISVDESSQTSTQYIAAPNTPIATKDVSGLLRNGSRGSEVEQMQKMLSGLGYNPGIADGIFGPNTETAVRSFQQANGLTVDGIVGKQTWGTLVDKYNSGYVTRVETTQVDVTRTTSSLLGETAYTQAIGSPARPLAPTRLADGTVITPYNSDNEITLNYFEKYVIKRVWGMITILNRQPILPG